MSDIRYIQARSNLLYIKDALEKKKEKENISANHFHFLLMSPFFLTMIYVSWITHCLFLEQKKEVSLVRNRFTVEREEEFHRLLLL